MVEFALLLPIFILLTVGIMDFGTGFWINGQVVNAAREGARVGTYDQTAASIRSAVKSTAPALSLSDADITIVCYSGFTSTTKSCGSAGLGDGVKVTVNKVWVPITPLIRAIPGVGSSVTLTSSAMRSVQ
jgi:Flp pilus assembly protein TadG